MTSLVNHARPTPVWWGQYYIRKCISQEHEPQKGSVALQVTWRVLRDASNRQAERAPDFIVG